jgi:LPXTG-motif cell wall-anchored protein
MLSIGLLEGTGGGADVTWLLWVALGFFALMVLVGWLSSRRQKPEETEPLPHGTEESHH